jgi:hypothetical protein
MGAHIKDNVCATRETLFRDGTVGALDAANGKEH